MHQSYCSTVNERVQIVSEMIANAGKYGVITQISSRQRVSRQTLYSWKEKGKRALRETFTPKEQPQAKSHVKLERAVLTLFVECHGSYRGIATCLEELLGEQVGLGTICGIVQEAGRRAQEWMSHQKPVEADCAVALDEQYGGKRGEGYLNVVDARSGLVWASVPEVPVDAESWTLLLWYLQEQGVVWQKAATDGGQAMQDALSTVKAASKQQRDTWHVSHLGWQVQGRVNRILGKLEEDLPTVQRQADRIAQGKKALGANPRTDVQAHQAQMRQVEYVACGLSYLRSEMRRLLSVVVLAETSDQGILESPARQGELETIVDLLVELEHDVPKDLAGEIKSLHKHLRLALPSLLLFARELDQIQQQVRRSLGEEAIHLIGWAWQRRQILGPSTAQLVEGFPPDWLPEVAQLLRAWDRAVRASSMVENWHSILRPHLAVHRRLTAGMLAILAVWHNHHVAPRGLHEGQSPLQRSGLQKQPTDWLVALGYQSASSAPAIARPISVKREHEVRAA